MKKQKVKFLCFNILMFLLLIFGIILQVTGIWKDCFGIEFQYVLETLVGVTTALVVGVFTILSIIISVQKDKIWGISNSDFKELQFADSFSFFWIIILLTLVAFNILAMLLSFRIICIAISVIEIIYVLYFCYQEIPILLRDDCKLWGIVRNRFRHEIIRNTTIDNEQKENLKKIISYLLFEKRIKKVYKELCYRFTENEKVTTFKYLLGIQRDRLFKNRDKNIELLLLEKNSTDIPITQLYESAINNIEALISFDESINVIEFLTENPYNDIALSLFYIANSKVNIVDNMVKNDINEGLIDIFKNNVFLSLTCSEIDNKKRDFLFGVLAATLIYTVESSEDWFLKILREYYTPEICVINNNPNISEFFIITCWFLYYAQKEKSPTNQATKKMVRNFINDCSKENLVRSNYESLSWKELYKEATDFGSRQNYFSFKTLLGIYKINGLPWYNMTAGVAHIYNRDDLTGLLSLLDWFFGMLFSSDDIYNIDFQKMFEECDDKEKSDIANYLNHNWIDNEQIKTSIELEGQRIFNSDRKIVDNINSYKNVKSLITWVKEIDLKLTKYSVEEAKKMMVEIGTSAKSNIHPFLIP